MECRKRDSFSEIRHRAKPRQHPCGADLSKSHPFLQYSSDFIFYDHSEVAAKSSFILVDVRSFASTTCTPVELSWGFTGIMHVKCIAQFPVQGTHSTNV